MTAVGSRRLAILAVPALAVLVGVVVLGAPRLRSYGSPRPPAAASGESVSIRIDSRQRIVNGQPVRLGASPTVLRVYLDFHCPECTELPGAYAATVDQAVGERTAQVAIYPVAFVDGVSAAAANAYACATEGGSAADYLAGLLANPDLRWTDTQLIALGDVTGSTFATAFATCVRQNTHRAWVESINRAARADGIGRTPAVFLGADPVDLATWTPERLSALLQR